MMNKKAMLEDLGAMAKGVAVLAIMLVVTFLIIAQARTQGAAQEKINWAANNSLCAKSTMCNATTTLNTAVAGIPGWVPLIIIVVIGAVVLGALKIFR